MKKIEESKSAKIDYSADLRESLRNRSDTIIPEEKLVLISEPYKSLISEIQEHAAKKTLLDIIWLLIKQPGKLLSIIYNVITIVTTFNKLKEFKMTNDQKATVLGALKSILIAVLTSIFGMIAGKADEWAQVIVLIVGGIWSIAELIAGIVTNKADKK